MPLPAVLNTCVEQVANRLRSSEPLVWIDDQPTQDDLQHITEETAYSRFDPRDLRKTMLADLQNGKAVLLCKRCRYAKVLLIGTPGLYLNWKLWARILQAFGPPPSHLQEPMWRIVLFASEALREFPTSPSKMPNMMKEEELPGPAHINGGYAYPKRPSSVIIYRKEEAERVLVHELLHAAGTDKMDDPEEQREALTETWAELFLIAIQANGSVRKAMRLWKEQAQWIANQNARLQLQYKVTSPKDYPWRYTVGREHVLRQLGIEVPKGNPQLAQSLRFTAPSLTE